jgi:hypothetical protein
LVENHPGRNIDPVGPEVFLAPDWKWRALSIRPCDKALKLLFRVLAAFCSLQSGCESQAEIAVRGAVDVEAFPLEQD